MTLLTGVTEPAAFPIESILEIIVAVALIIIAAKLVKSIAKPLFITIVIIAALLVVFGVVDIAFFASTGEKLLHDALMCAQDKVGSTDAGTVVAMLGR